MFWDSGTGKVIKILSFIHALTGEAAASLGEISAFAHRRGNLEVWTASCRDAGIAVPSAPVLTDDDVDWTAALHFLIADADGRRRDLRASLNEQWASVESLATLDDVEQAESEVAKLEAYTADVLRQ